MTASLTRALLLFLFLCLGGCPRAQTICGDCTLDSVITVLDVLAAAQHDVGLQLLTGHAFQQCDVNASSTVTVLDALALAQFAAGLPVVLTCPSTTVAQVLEPELGGMLVNELVLSSPKGIEVLNTTPSAFDLSGHSLLVAGLTGIPSPWFTFPGAAGSQTTVAQPGVPVLVTEDAGAPTATHHFADSALDWTNPILGGYVLLLDAGLLPLDFVVAGSPLFVPPLPFDPPFPIGLQSIARVNDDDTDAGSDWASTLVPTREALNSGQTGLGTTAGRFRGDVLMTYLLFDPESDPCDVMVDWTSDAGATWAPATERTGFPSEGVTGLASDPGGARHLFVWDAIADIGPVLAPAARLRVIPDDGGGPGIADESADMIIDGANDVPVVTVLTPAPAPVVRVNEVYLGTPDGIEICSFGPAVVDLSGWRVTTADVTGAETQWFTFPPGTMAPPATPIQLTDDSGADTPTHFHTGVGLSWSRFLGGRAWISDTGGQVLDFVEFGFVLGGTPPVPWTGGGASTGTNFLARTDDGDTDDASDWSDVASGTPELLNPGQTGMAPVPPLGTPLDVFYSLTDVQGDPCDLTVELSLDGGVSWQGVTQAMGGDGTAGLSASAAGTPHVYAWDAGADLGLGFHNGLLLRLTAQDLFGVGAPDTTMPFDLALGDVCPGFPIAAGDIVNADTAGFGDSAADACGGAGSPDNVFHLVAEGEGEITASLCGAAFDTVLYVREGDCAGPTVACGDDDCGLASEARWTPTCGQDYYLFVDGKAGAAGAYTLDVSQQPAARELCPGEDITGTGMASGTTDCGGLLGISLTCPVSALSPDNVYSFTASLTGSLRASLCGGTSFNSVLYIREGSCFALADLGCDDDACMILGASELTVPCTAGETYFIFVDGNAGASGDYTLTVTEF